MGDLVFKRPHKLMGLGLYPPIAGMPWHWLPGHVCLAVDIVAAIPFVFLLRQWSTTITADGITVQTLRRRFIPWSDVRDIRTDYLAGDYSIDVHLHDGTRQRLPAPVERYRADTDATFFRKYVEILELWRTHGRPSLSGASPEAPEESPETIGREPQDSGPGM